MTRALRRITAIGNSLGVTLPRHLLKAGGLHRGSLVEVVRAREGVLIRSARIVTLEPTNAPGATGRAALAPLKAGLRRIYGVRLRSVNLYRSDVSEQRLRLRVLVVLDSISDYGIEIERTGSLISRLSLLHAVSISRVFVSEYDWLKRRPAGTVAL